MGSVTKRTVWMMCLLPLLVLGGCASAGGPASTSGNRDVLTEADLSGMDELSVYGAIRRLRPSWLRPRGQSTLNANEAIRVYLDGGFFGEVRALLDMPLQGVQEVRYLDSRQATLRFGTGHTAGAILVTSKR